MRENIPKAIDLRNMQSEKIPMDGELGNSGLKAKITSRFKKRSEESPEKKVMICYVYTLLSLINR